MGRCVMFFIWQTTGIDKMRVGAAKLSSTLVHKVCKCFGGTGDVLSNGIVNLGKYTFPNTAALAVNVVDVCVKQSEKYDHNALLVK